MTLKVWTDGTDTVIATDIADVRAVIESHAGSFESDEDEWDTIAPDKTIRIHNFSGHEDTVERTAAEWIATEGRGFLCSTEY